MLKKYGKGLKVNKFSSISSTASVMIGNNCNFNGMNVSGAGTVFFGDNFHSGTDCRIMLGTHDYDFGETIPYGSKCTKKEIIIENNVWLGTAVIISGNVTIGEGAIVAVGAVVVKNVPKCAIVGGNPAKVIKYRNIDHYEFLKKEKKFH